MNTNCNVVDNYNTAGKCIHAQSVHKLHVMGCSLNTRWSVPEGVVDVGDVVGRSVIVVICVVDDVVVVVAVAVEGDKVVLCVDAT